MVDSYTTTASSGLDHAAYNLAIDGPLRAELYYVPLATVRPTAQAHPGTSVTFNLFDDLAVVSTALDESTDVSAVAITDSSVTLTLQEYGNATIPTAKLRATSVVPFDPVVANVVARNAAISLDTLAVIQLRAGSNVRYATGGGTDPSGRTTIEPTDTLDPADVRRAFAELEGANVAKFGDAYVGFIHPDVVFDFMTNTDGAGWTVPANYSDASRRWNGEIGKFNGVRFVATSRAPVFADAGSSTTLTDVYATIIIGQQGLAKAFGTTAGYRENPVIVVGPMTDKLERFRPLGWKWFGAFGRYREAAIRRIESASSIGGN